MLSSVDWNEPGTNPFLGSVPAAVSAYTDIPNNVRNVLRERMEKRQYDDIVLITKHGISGTHGYTGLRDMHFGNGLKRGPVSKERWKSTDQEIGLVYCEEQECILVPTVCRNVSRVTKLPRADKLANIPSLSVEETLSYDMPTPDLSFSLPLLDTSIVGVVTEVPASAEPKAQILEWPITQFVPSPRMDTAPVAVIPEVSTYMMFLLGLGMLVYWKMVRMNDKICTYCGRHGHRASQCPYRGLSYERSAALSEMLQGRNTHW